MPIPTSAFILIGGKSRRFGSPKWAAELQGITLVQRAWNLCDSLFERVSLVTKEGEGPRNKPVVYDILEIRSPLSGIYSVLQGTEREWNFVLSCDLPLIDHEIVRELWGYVSPDVQIVVPITSRGVEPTCAFYSAAAISHCERLISRNDYALHHLVGMATSRVVDFSEREERFLNVNTREDLKRAEAHLTGNGISE